MSTTKVTDKETLINMFKEREIPFNLEGKDIMLEVTNPDRDHTGVTGYPMFETTFYFDNADNLKGIVLWE